MLHQDQDPHAPWDLPGLHFLGFEAAGGRGGAPGLLAELHQGLVVLLLLLLLLFVTGQDEEETQDGLQVAIPDLWRDGREENRHSPPRFTM